MMMPKIVGTITEFDSWTGINDQKVLHSFIEDHINDLSLHFLEKHLKANYPAKLNEFYADIAACKLANNIKMSESEMVKYAHHSPKALALLKESDNPEIQDCIKISNNKRIIDANKDLIVNTFAPNFYFHSDEDSFPMPLQEYVDDVVQARNKALHEKTNVEDLIHANLAHDLSTNKILPHRVINNEITSGYVAELYLKLQGQEESKTLDEHSKPVLAFIKKYFIQDGKFIAPDIFAENGELSQNKMWAFPDPKFTEGFLDNIMHDKRSNFLNLDERGLGKKVGELINTKGTNPKDSSKTAPTYTSIIPLPDGALIKYEHFFAVSSTIPGTKTLFEHLPAGISAKADNFAFHYGDWEGVFIKVKIDDKGAMKIDGMQTFAHGRDGAHFTEAKDLSYDADGKPCVFVAQSTHASYAQQFSNVLGVNVLRNQFADVVGNDVKFTPSRFVDTSLEQIVEHRNKPIEEALRNEDLSYLLTFARTGDSESSIFSDTANANTYAEYKERSKEWHRYEPQTWHNEADLGGRYGKNNPRLLPSQMNKGTTHIVGPTTVNHMHHVPTLDTAPRYANNTTPPLIGNVGKAEIKTPAAISDQINLMRVLAVGAKSVINYFGANASEIEIKAARDILSEERLQQMNKIVKEHIGPKLKILEKHYKKTMQQVNDDYDTPSVATSKADLILHKNMMKKNRADYEQAKEEFLAYKNLVVSFEDLKDEREELVSGIKKKRLDCIVEHADKLGIELEKMPAFKKPKQRIYVNNAKKGTSMLRKMPALQKPKQGRWSGAKKGRGMRGPSM